MMGGWTKKRRTPHGVLKTCVPFLLTLCLSSCAGVTPLAAEAPYARMIGQCYVLQQDMNVRENICWELGDLILSPDEGEDCLRNSLSRVSAGKHLTLLDVRRKRWGSAGYCPQAIVRIDGVIIEGREIYLPLCYSSNKISWLENSLWRRGDEFDFKPGYLKPCYRED